MARSPKAHHVSSEQIEAAEAAILDRSKRIEFYTTEYTIELLAEKMAREDFVIPDYQRAYTWDEARKSKFIESVVMGLPIPFLFFWEMPNGKLEVVDGSQRLRTILEYVKQELKLSKLDEIKPLNGTKFSDLPESRRRKILNKSIRGIVLNESADPQARSDMFERINTGSKVANPAEVRRGALAGEFQSLVQELAALPLFFELAPVSVKSKRERVPEELVTRFFAYGDGLETYKDSPNRFVYDYTAKMNLAVENNQVDIEEYRERFVRMLEFVQRTFPNGFTKPENPRTTPRVRFEAISIGVDKALQERPAIGEGDPLNVTEWLAGNDFKVATTSDAANVKSKLERRISYVKNALLDQ